MSYDADSPEGLDSRYEELPLKAIVVRVPSVVTLQLPDASHK